MRGIFLLVVLVVACTPPATQPQGTVDGSISSTPTHAASARASTPTSAGANVWRRIADIPTARSEVAAAFSEQTGKAFVVGGSGGPQRVERYNPATNTWDRVADLPISVDHAMAAAVEGLQSNAPQGVFVFGGYVGGTATARSFRFDTRTERWEEIAPMPAPRAAGVALANSSSIFIVGGASDGRLVAPTYEYEVISRVWRTRAALPTPRDHLAGAVLDPSHICAIGGRRLSLAENLPTFECSTRDRTRGHVCRMRRRRVAASARRHPIAASMSPEASSPPGRSASSTFSTRGPMRGRGVPIYRRHDTASASSSRQRRSRSTARAHWRSRLRGCSFSPAARRRAEVRPRRVSRSTCRSAHARRARGRSSR